MGGLRKVSYQKWLTSRCFAGEDAPAWDGQEAPRLLAKETRPAPAEAGGVVHEAITKYAWGDETEKVK